MSTLELRELLDLPALQRLLEDFQELTGAVVAILDLKGEVLVQVGWQDVCTKFHRAHPDTARSCTESDLYLAGNVKRGECVAYGCKNGLWDVVTPLMVGDAHAGNIYTGQFFYEDQIVDLDRFVAQSRTHGFDREAYLDAVARVPRLSHARVARLMSFLARLTGVISRSALAALEAQRTQQELAASEARHRLLTENAHDIIWTMGLDGRFTYVSPSIERVMGFTVPEVMNKSFLEVITPGSLGAAQDHFLKGMQELAETGDFSPVSGEFEQPRKDGSTVWTDVTTSPLHDEAGRVIGVIGVSRDIDARKRAEREKARLEAELHQAQKMESIGRLAGGVAHDFNNMLSVILGHAELALEHAREDDPLRQDLLQIHDAARHSADLTRQLLAFARKQTVAPRVLDLNQTIAGLHRMLQRLIGEAIHLELVPQPGLQAVSIDPSQLDQILANLCVNARDAIDGTGTIRIETADEHRDASQDHPGDWVRLSVTDDGCGMSPEVLEHVFEPFYTTKDAGAGTGLGLATVYGAVVQNGGFVHAESSPGKGSRFSIHLPRHERELEHAGSRPREQAQRGRETILVVEDEAPLLRLAQRYLEKQGYRVLTAPSPSRALEISREFPERIDLLLTDVIMPDLNGRRLFEQIEAQRSGIRCLFMSGYTDDVIASHGMLDPGVSFLAKPFSIGALGAMVREVLDA